MRGEPCPRCGRVGIQDHEEWWCFEHGTYGMRPAPWDATAEVRGSGVPKVPWSEQERLAWDTWRPGDPVPGWARSSTEEVIAQMGDAEGEITGNQLAKGLRRRLDVLAEEADGLVRSLEAHREEAAKIAGYFAYTGDPVTLPEVLQGGRKQGKKRGGSKKMAEPVECCGRVFDTSQGLAMHRTKKHTEANA